MSGPPSPVPLSLGDDASAGEKKAEHLAAREARIAKREKEIANKQAEVDRKLKAAEDQEEKLGTVMQRELALEQGNHSILQSQKEVRRKEKAVKDLEHTIAERDQRSLEREARVQAAEKQLANREASCDERASNTQQDLERAQQLSQEAAARCKRLEDDEEDLKKRQEELHAAERVVRRREQNLTEDETEAARRTKELREREEGVDKLNLALQARQTTLTAKELQNQSERDRLSKLSKQLSDEEKSRNAEVEHLVALRVELQQLQATTEELRHVAQREQDEAAVKIAEADGKRAVVEKQTIEIVQLQRDLSTTKADLTQLDAELKKRERRLTSENRELEHQRAVMQQRKSELDAFDTTLQHQATALTQRQKDLEHNERVFMELKARHETDFAALAQLEATMKRRSDTLAKKEEELLQWLRELEWREVVLADREATVDREPIPLAMVAPAAGGTATQASLERCELRRGSFAAGNGGRAQGNEDDDDARRAYGKALIDVQLRRLKDRYVSAHLKWASLEISERGGTPPRGNTTAASITPPRAMRQQHGHATPPRTTAIATGGLRARAKTGIAVAAVATHDEEVQRATTLAAHRAAVHRLGVDVLRTVSKLRSFDPNEPDSALKQREIDVFSDQERSLIAFAVNFEFLMKHMEVAVSTMLTSCPLDAKEQAIDAKDLLNKTVAWWAQQRLGLTERMTQLLTDRRKYLEAAAAALALHKDDLTLRRGGTGLEEAEGVTGEGPMTSKARSFVQDRRRGGDAEGVDNAPQAAGRGEMQRQDSYDGATNHTYDDGEGEGELRPSTSYAGRRRTSLVDHCMASPIIAPSSGATARANLLKTIELDAAANQRQRELAGASGGAAGVFEGRRSFRQIEVDHRTGLVLVPSKRGGAAGTVSIATDNASFPSHEDGGGGGILVSPAASTNSPLAGSSGPFDLRRANAPAVATPTADRRPSTTEGSRQWGSAGTAMGGRNDVTSPTSKRLQLQRGGAVAVHSREGLPFGTVPEATDFCLMRTGRASSAEPSRRCLATAVAAEKQRKKKPLHSFEPPALWSGDRLRTVPKILQDAAASIASPQPSLSQHTASAVEVGADATVLADTDLRGSTPPLPRVDVAQAYHSPYLSPVVGRHRPPRGRHTSSE